MLTFALGALRLKPFDPEVSSRILAADLATADRIGSARLERTESQPMVRAMLARTQAAILLASGREADAEDAFERARRYYGTVSRVFVRSHAALDQGAMFLHLNRPGRAAECFAEVLTDRSLDADARVEGLAGHATALFNLGELGRARRSLSAASALAPAGHAPLAGLMDCLSLEIEASATLRSADALQDHALWQQLGKGDAAPLDAETLVRRLDAKLADHADTPLVAERLRMLRDSLLSQRSPGVLLASPEGVLGFLHRHRLVGFEPAVRIELALAMLSSRTEHGVAEVLAPLLVDERVARRGRHALDLEYCLFRLHMAKGRPQEALRAYKQHTEDTLLALRKELSRALSQRNGTEDAAAAPESDSAELRLPLRYRKAYRFMIENLPNPALSIKWVAEHIDVTERALQIAFRTHLGESPAEFIRRRRMEAIHRELQAHADASVLDIASNWGVQSRSTLAQAYRKNFHETPSQTRRGGMH